MLKKFVVGLFVVSICLLGYAIFLYKNTLKVKDVVIAATSKEQFERELKPYRNFLITMSVLTVFFAVVLMAFFSQKTPASNTVN